MNEEELRKDILFDIEMQLYDEFNDTIATMNDHLGEIYGYSDVENVKQAEKNRKIELMENAIKHLQNNWNTLKQKLEKTIKSIEKESLINFKKEKNCYQKVLNQMLEIEKENE